MSAAEKPVTITVDLTRGEALAYAQFLKRVCHDDYRRDAVDSHEARIMMQAGERIRESLARVGFAPR